MGLCSRTWTFPTNEIGAKGTRVYQIKIGGVGKLLVGDSYGEAKW